MTPAQHLTWDSRPGADGTNVHLPKYSEVEAAEAEPAVVVAIVGSREKSWADPNAIAEFVDDLLDGWGDALVISGHASSGVDFWVEESCKRRGIPFKPFPADWHPNGTYNPRAGFERNEVMAQAATDVIAIWDGKSGGTKDMIDRALSHKKALVVHFP